MASKTGPSSSAPRVALDVWTQLRPQGRARDHIDRGAQEPGELALEPQEGEQSRVGREVDEDVDVAVRVLVAPGDAAEDLQVAGAVRRCDRLHLVVVTPDTLP